MTMQPKFHVHILLANFLIIIRCSLNRESESKMEHFNRSYRVFLTNQMTYS